MASKFSSANPRGSIRTWQTAHAGLARCCSIRCLMVRALVSLFSFKDGTLGGGGGGGAPRTFSRIHLPRMVGAVRLAYDVTVKILALPKRPRRTTSLKVTRRKWLP